MPMPPYSQKQYVKFYEENAQLKDTILQLLTKIALMEAPKSESQTQRKPGRPRKS